MNSTQQKTHRTVTQTLARSIEEVAHSVEAVAEAARQAVGTERTHRIRLAEEQRSYVDARDRELRQCCQDRWDATADTTKRIADRHAAFAGRGFWSRINWIVTGR